MTYIEYLEFELLMFISNSCLALALTLPRYLKSKGETNNFFVTNFYLMTLSDRI